MDSTQLQDLLLNSAVSFDAEYYLFCNDDVRLAGIDPLAHFLAHGHLEGRDPSPNFSYSGYLYAYPDAALSGLPALTHYLTVGQTLGRESCPVIDGRLPYQADRPTVLLCGHLAETTLFGAELSLIDLAKAYKKLNFNLVISLPSAKNSAYLDKLTTLCCAICVFPQLWWQRDRVVFPAIVARFSAIFERFNIAAVHLNTLVHYEAAIAARAQAIPVLMHVRELPAVDTALCERLHATAEQVRLHVWQWADVVVANSQFTRQFYQHPQAKVIYNCVDTHLLEQLPQLEPKVMSAEKSHVAPVVISLISSNVPKKGINDFVLLAQRFEKSHPTIIFRFVGPDNSYIAELQRQQTLGELPANIQFSGYVKDIAYELNQSDIVLSLSHFQESFGRTVLEAMAAAKVVICYRWGALPELLEHGTEGFLVPYADLDAIARIINDLLIDRIRLSLVGRAAKARVLSKFSAVAMSTELQKLYVELWSAVDEQA